METGADGMALLLREITPPSTSQRLPHSIIFIFVSPCLYFRYALNNSATFSPSTKNILPNIAMYVSPLLLLRMVHSWFFNYALSIT
jgi:hypothetical protein